MSFRSRSARAGLALALVLALAPGSGLLAAPAAPAAPAQGDAVDTALQAARQAYAQGRLDAATSELAAAGRALQSIKHARLAAFLPAAPEGWSRSVQKEAEAGALSLLGMGGITAAADYARNGESFTVSLTADNPLVASMLGLLGNPQMMALMGKVVRVGSRDMMLQDGELSTLVDGRVLVQARGRDLDAMKAALGTLAFNRVARYAEGGEQ